MLLREEEVSCSSAAFSSGVALLASVRVHGPPGPVWPQSPSGEGLWLCGTGVSPEPVAQITAKDRELQIPGNWSFVKGNAEISHGSSESAQRGAGH